MYILLLPLQNLLSKINGKYIWKKSIRVSKNIETKHKDYDVKYNTYYKVCMHSDIIAD